MSTSTRQGKRARRPSALSNPVLVGAMTVLVIMVAVFLAYNANTGLPFVPTDELKVDVATGSDLVPGNEVREGGFLIGLVQSLTPIQLPSGQVAGQLTLKLNKANGKVPVDSTASIRPRRCSASSTWTSTSARSQPGLFTDGGTLPITQTTSRSSSRTSSRPLTPRRASRSTRTSSASATRSPAAARRSTTPSPACRRCWATSSR